jgi:chromosome segregation ATPase
LSVTECPEPRHHRCRDAGAQASTSSIRADLLSLHKNRELRDEIHRLKTLRERLGAELVDQSVHRLQAQIATLRETNTRVIAERDAAVEERNVLIEGPSATEDDLAAARRSLTDFAAGDVALFRLAGI